jgi:hypothetical protein
VCPAVLLIYLISAATLVASLALTVQLSLPYNKVGRATVLYDFILVLFRVLFGRNTLFIVRNFQTFI